jgi:molybdopterin converting factor small subunit
MKVSVRYFAQARQAAGISAEDVEFSGVCSLMEVLGRVSEVRGENLRRLLLDDSGKPQEALLIFVGEEQCSPDAAQSLKDGDVIEIVPPMSGG